MWEKIFNEEIDLKLKCDALIRMMWICQDEENWDKLRELLHVYDELDTDEFKDDVRELRKALRKRRS